MNQVKPNAAQPKPWNDPRVRALFFQAAAIVAVFYAGWTLFDNTLTNMESRGISTGFGFLDQSAGFGIIMSLIPYDATMSYGRTFFVGLLNTLLVSAMGIVTATILGFVIGVARLSSNWLIAKLSLVYIEVIRNIPILLQIFFWYFAVLGALPSPRQSMDMGGMIFLNNRGLSVPEPITQPGFGWVIAAIVFAIAAVVVIKRWAHKRQLATGQIFPTVKVSLVVLIALPVLAYLITGGPLEWSVPELKGFNFGGGYTVLPELAALWVALTLFTASYIAEIVRSGILSVSKGQTEAARALGLHSGMTLRLVVIPQAMRVIIPPLTSQYLNLFKNSSLATAIGYPDLVSVFMGTTLNQTGQAVEVVAMTMAVYLAVSLLISFFMNIYNRAVALKER
ncbi:MAG: amino acid ABC transporter permease [Alteromonadaceae bacterium]|uniref:amino acid ABC transporter permease n=1 Tax=Marinobacter sp. BGYM27 TaxID=2975597 RepID=UPI000C67C3C5|nr:amino acid ABC transporter permease [Marinobacter sp. BGYM27]MAA65422.1 amino acid ABC transporter permease [Alteromonadaceae bacterium]MBH85088.1 amino acid ABC transporter permease [Alteromonadaceae bacterium]MDG5500117.1 amino acid ABC transporter permease [Marinobacter sp. BGYM27]|tara:strand:- start:14338 stop:15519 length:1182 start_codon:yes stop_codon:yes gene_type:complete